MISIQYLLLAFAPGLLWLWFFRSKDDLEPEPPRNCLICFALGCGSVFLVLWIRPHFEALLPTGTGGTYFFLDSFLVSAGLEEICKLGPTYSPVFDIFTNKVPVSVQLEKREETAEVLAA